MPQKRHNEPITRRTFVDIAKGLFQFRNNTQSVIRVLTVLLYNCIIKVCYTIV